MCKAPKNVRKMGRRIYFDRKEVIEWFNLRQDTSAMEIFSKEINKAIIKKDSLTKSIKVSYESA